VEIFVAMKNRIKRNADPRVQMPWHMNNKENLAVQKHVSISTRNATWKSVLSGIKRSTPTTQMHGVSFPRFNTLQALK
jgi:hypothetical protein